MSLQRRLLVLLGISFTLLWLSVAALLYLHLNRQVSETLDQRLAASATMVAGLIAQQPEMLLGSGDSPFLVSPESEGVACQIRSAAGKVLLKTNGVGGMLSDGIETGFSNRNMGGEDWHLYTLSHKDVLITTADRMTERNDLQNGIIIVTVLPFVLALIGSLIVLWWGIRQELQPLQRLYGELRRREPGNLEPVNIGIAPAELKPIVGTLNRLLFQVERAVRREQRFASNAAHEFRTPLTAIKIHLQVAQRVSGDRQMFALNSAEKGVERLQRVTEQLLMLARLERNNDWPISTECCISSVVTDALADIPDDRRIEVSVSSGNAPINVPLALAAVAVRNVVENALKYSLREHPVELSASSIDGMARFVVRDYGDGSPRRTGAPLLTAADLDIRGHGLGLAIVDAILVRFNGELRLQHNDVGGLDWFVEFQVRREA